VDKETFMKGKDTIKNLLTRASSMVGILDAQTQINLGGVRVIRRAGTDSFFAGVFAGNGQTTGTGNSFFGYFAGSQNSTGSENSYFGNSAGSVTTGSGNAFFGSNAGANGAGAADDNTFMGHNADFIGSLRTGDHNTLLGSNAKLDQIGANPLKYATAIGAGARAQFSDMVVLGKEAGVYGGVARPLLLSGLPGYFRWVRLRPPAAARFASTTESPSVHRACGTKRTRSHIWAGWMYSDV
jgi:hypothetical protein